MGKKRRLISAKQKFKAKHSHHPVMVTALRDSSEDEELKVEEPVVEAKEEPVIVKEEKAEELPKPKVRKKRRPRKKATKKEK